MRSSVKEFPQYCVKMLANTKVLTALLPCLAKILLLKTLMTLRFGKFFAFLLRRMQQGLPPCKDDNAKRLKFNKRKAHGVQLPHA